MEVNNQTIFVDKYKNSIIVPIGKNSKWILVPFHISLIKNVSMNSEGNISYLRLNFFTPGTQQNKSAIVKFPHLTGHSWLYIKELCLKGKEEKLSKPFKDIKELQKRVKLKDQIDIN